MQRIFQPELISLDKTDIPIFTESDIQVYVLRLDKIHPIISGNKYFKLKYHMQYAIENKFEGILTFGGAWSNHIVATACTASLHQLKSIGIIRGENTTAISNTLHQARECGMQLEFISRMMYRNIHTNEYKNELANKFPQYYIIPEGGGGDPGIKGASEIPGLVDYNEYTHIACAIGTGTTYCGIVNASHATQHIIGIPVLKGVSNLYERFIKSPLKKTNCTFFYDYHFGGYAKYDEMLITFMNEFYRQTNIPTDFVYTAKLFFAVQDLAHKKFFAPGSRVLVIHSGGLQGNSSLDNGTLNF